MRMSAAAALALLVTAVPAAARTLDKVPAALDPSKAYVLVEYQLEENTIAPGMPGSRKYNPITAGLVLARYDPVAGDVRGLGKATANPAPDGKPAEPFRNRELAKGEGRRLFLLEVEPDTWVIQGAGTTSFALGSYAFRLAAGTVTDLGVAAPTSDWAEGQRAVNTGDLFKMALMGPFAKRPAVAPMRVAFHPRGSGDLPVPAGLVTVPVAFTPDARFGNHMGGLVNRIEGVNARAKAAGQ